MDYPDNWRELADSIKDRDGRRCAICRTRKPPLNAHHIEGRTTDDPANLITLCEDCHLRLVHDKRRRRPAKFRGLLLLLAGRRAGKNRSIRRMNRRKPR
jgi:5-methylcytosine-specific restriction endonuclease McrA